MCRAGKMGNENFTQTAFTISFGVHVHTLFLNISNIFLTRFIGRINVKLAVIWRHQQRWLFLEGAFALSAHRCTFYTGSSFRSPVKNSFQDFPFQCFLSVSHIQVRWLPIHPIDITSPQAINTSFSVRSFSVNTHFFGRTTTFL